MLWTKASPGESGLSIGSPLALRASGLVQGICFDFGDAKMSEEPDGRVNAIRAYSAPRSLARGQFGEDVRDTEPRLRFSTCRPGTERNRGVLMR
jgi:hypothetical protein